MSRKVSKGIVIGVLIALLSAWLFWYLTLGSPFMKVYYGQEIDNLKTADMLWLNHVKQVSPGVVIGDPLEIKNLLDNISFSCSDHGACGYQWKLFFFREGKLFEKVYLVNYCHRNIETSFGCFLFNRKFEWALHPYIKKLNKHDGTFNVYDFNLSAGDSIDQAFDKIKRLGLSPCLFKENTDKEIVISTEMEISSIYSIQVLFPKVLTEQEIQDFIQREPSIKEIKLNESY